MGYYRTAQICLNGHCITPNLEISSSLSQEYCDKCGAKTICACPECGAHIRGEYHVDGVVTFGGSFTVPAFCCSCGAAFPWTSSALDAIKELISEEDELLEMEKEKLIASLPDIITETPKTQLAATRIKKALVTAGKFTAEGIRQFVIDFGCELALKLTGVSN